MGASRAAAGGSGDDGGLLQRQGGRHADGLNRVPASGPVRRAAGTAAEGVASGLSRSFQAAERSRELLETVLFC